MPERERLYAILRIFGYIDKVRREVAEEIYNSMGQLLLEELYTFHVKKEDVDELIEEVKRSMGLTDDHPLVKILRGQTPGDSSGQPDSRR